MQGPNNLCFLIQVLPNNFLEHVVGLHRLLREQLTTSMSRPNVVSLVQLPVLIRQPIGAGMAFTWRRLLTAILPKAGYMGLLRTNQSSNPHDHATPVVEFIKVAHWKKWSGESSSSAQFQCLHTCTSPFDCIHLPLGVQRWDRRLHKGLISWFVRGYKYEKCNAQIIVYIVSRKCDTDCLLEQLLILWLKMCRFCDSYTTAAFVWTWCASFFRDGWAVCEIIWTHTCKFVCSCKQLEI